MKLAAAMMWGCLLLAVTPASAEPIVLSFSPSPSSVSVGQTFSVDLLVSDITDLYTYQFNIAFDPSRLQAIGITEGPFLGTAGSTFFIPGTIDNAAGSIDFTANTLIGAINGASGNGALASIQFQALASGTNQIRIRVDSGFGSFLLLDSQGNFILDDQGLAPSLLPGTVNVSTASGSAVPEPSTVALLSLGLPALALCRRRS